MDEHNGGTPIKVVANLPYYITTPIIMGLFESGVPIDNITVMVQKEVADRMQVGPRLQGLRGAFPGGPVLRQPPTSWPTCRLTVSSPRPNVGSAVIRLTRYKEPPVQVTDPALMFRLIRASFNQRRKTLQNGLNNSPELSYTKEDIAEAIAGLDLPASVRGEALTLEQFAALANYFTEHF